MDLTLGNKPLAPVVLFVYNRPTHTEKALHALLKNPEIYESPFFIYCDGPKAEATTDELNNIKLTRAVVNRITGVDKLHIKVNKINKGLASSIIEGVSEVLQSYEYVIVLEDDLLVSNRFLSFMNTALQRYNGCKQVKQVSGFCFPFQLIEKGSSFFAPFTTTWGWATWKYIWDSVDFSCKDALKQLKSIKVKAGFNLENTFDYSTMLIDELVHKKNDSWGIRFWWNVFKEKGVVLHPGYPLVQNIGFDNSGTHIGENKWLLIDSWDPNVGVDKFPINTTVDNSFFNAVKEYLKKYGGEVPPSNVPYYILNKYIKWFGFKN